MGDRISAAFEVGKIKTIIWEGGEKTFTLEMNLACNFNPFWVTFARDKNET